MRVLFFAVPCAVLAQQPQFNLDFEISTRGALWLWPSFGPGTFSVDTSTFLSGSQSLRIRAKIPLIPGAGPALPVILSNADYGSVTGVFDKPVTIASAGVLMGLSRRVSSSGT